MRYLNVEPVSKEDFEDSRILPCPICGGKAYYRNVVLYKGYNSIGKAPEGAVITRIAEKVIGGEVYWWERRGYAIHCLTQKCRCRTPMGGRRTLEEAISEWNRNRSAVECSISQMKSD